eukprot:9475547-Pyramimonas_sp.AAC.1
MEDKARRTRRARMREVGGGRLIVSFKFERSGRLETASYLKEEGRRLGPRAGGRRRRRRTEDSEDRGREEDGRGRRGPKNSVAATYMRRESLGAAKH